MTDMEKTLLPEQQLEQELFSQLRYFNENQYAFAKKAYEFSKQAHIKQTRASGEPYIIHPMGVCKILAELQLDEETIAAAFLHDVVEDTDITLDKIKEEFGATVAMLVDGVTKLSKIEYISKEEHQIENYRKMFMAMAKDIRVVLIKLADRLHNMRTLKFMNPMKQRTIAKETMEIFAPLAHRLGIYKIKWELEDLAFRYMDPERYYDLVEQVKQKRHEREKMIDSAIVEIREALLAVDVECEIQGRPKNFYSIYKKMQKNNSELSEIYDLLAIRVLVDSVKDCYGAIGIVHSLWRPIPGRFKDYVAVPKSNMYQSLHTTVISNFGQPLEIQIRTFEMHRISEFGIAAHWRYKEGKSGPTSGFDDKLSWLKQLLEWHQDMKDPKEFVDSVKMDVFTDEVFVFTPRGDVIDLPKGSVPIDFAYRIHTDVGNRCIGAKVNGRIVPLEHKLSNGDIVEIITSKQANGPSRDWLNIVCSNDSKVKIRQWFKRERRDENIVKGKEMLEKEIKRLGYDVKSFLKPERLKTVATKLTIDNDENLFASLGYGGVTLQAVMTRLVEIYKQEEKSTTNKNMSEMLAELKTKSSGEKTKGRGILVKGESGLLVRLAKCCNPVPGDQIVGYITRGRGVSVHLLDCTNIKNNKEEYERMIEVSWDIDSADSKYKVTIQILSNNNTGAMANIMMVASETKVNISSMSAKIDEKNKTAQIMLGIEVNSQDHLEYIMGKMRRVKDVHSVVRYISSGGHRED